MFSPALTVTTGHCNQCSLQSVCNKIDLITHFVTQFGITIFIFIILLFLLVLEGVQCDP